MKDDGSVKDDGSTERPGPPERSTNRGRREDTLPETPMARAGEDRAPLREGDRVGQHYRIVRLIAHGGMGAVYQARDENLDRDVAIKIVRPQLATNAVTLERFRAEARAMARLSHPHVVGIHAVGEIDGRPYLVMEYVPGTNLSRFLAERGRSLRVEEALAILDQVCRGVSAMHAAGVVHRDLKPGNILLGPAFRVVVSDLGLSRDVGEANDGWGTPGYSAPELHEARSPRPELAPRLDVYSIGAMAYELLTGTMPFATEGARLCAMEGGIMPEPPSSRAPRLGPELDAPILAALAWTPDERTPSVDALRRALASHGADRPPPPRRLRILVADDDPSYGDMVGRLLARTFRGAVVETVGDGSTAFASAIARRPDLVVADLDMPGMNGVELVAALRADARTEKVPVVVVSAIGGPTDWALLGRLGANAFLGKPFDPGQLTALARAVID